MSYIRSTSNPEKLYIWNSGKVEIMVGPKGPYVVPTNVFHGLIRKYVRMHWPDECSYLGLSLKEVWVNQKPMIKGSKIKVGDLKLRLSYKNWKIDMWQVTWHYIVSTNYDDIKTSRRNR